MYSGKPIRSSTESAWEKLELIKRTLSSAAAVVVGAGAGLSAAAGMAYSGQRFEENFGDFIARYHFSDMYSAGFYPYETPEEYWAYWSRHICLNRYDRPVGRVYYDLLELVGQKDYFVLTTNVDHCFQQAGFDKRRLFYTQGDYGLWQCAKPCHQRTYDNEAAVRRMAAEQTALRVPTELLPRCPVCGAPMAMNLRVDSRFVQDDGWYAARGRYQDFLRLHQHTGIVFLELGVGYNTPGIIRYPFEALTGRLPGARLVRINSSSAGVPREIRRKSVSLREDLAKALSDLLSTYSE